MIKNNKLSSKITIIVLIIAKLLLSACQSNSSSKVDFVESSVKNSMISYGTLKDNPNIDYINSKVFMPEFEEGKENEVDFEKESKKLEKIVNDAIEYLKDTDGIIIDVRDNGGGGKWTTAVSVQDTEFINNDEYQGFEGRGIEPDILMIPTKEEVESGKDIHIEKAIEIIQSGK